MFKKQELGETVDEMMKDDMKDVERIINKNPQGHFWVLIHHKPTKKRMQSGEQVLVRVCKRYDKKPRPLLGTIIFEVKGGGVIVIQVNLHDMPVDMERLSPHLGSETTPLVEQRPDIAGAYIYNNK